MDPFWTPTLEDLKKYFSDEEWSKLTDYEKKNYTNIMENFNIMNDLGKYHYLLCLILSSERALIWLYLVPQEQFLPSFLL